MIPKFPPTWTSKFNCIQLSIAVARKHSVVSHVAAWRTALWPCWHTDPWPVCERRLGLREVGGHGSRQQLPKLPSKILQAKASHLMSSSLMVPKGEQWCTSVPVVDLWWILRCKIKALRNLWTGTIRCLSLAKSYSFLQARSKQGPPNVPCKVCSTVNMLCVCVIEYGAASNLGFTNILWILCQETHQWRLMWRRPVAPGWKTRLQAQAKWRQPGMRRFPALHVPDF